MICLFGYDVTYCNAIEYLFVHGKEARLGFHIKHEYIHTCIFFLHFACFCIKRLLYWNWGDGLISSWPHGKKVTFKNPITLHLAFEKDVHNKSKIFA